MSHGVKCYIIEQVYLFIASQNINTGAFLCTKRFVLSALYKLAGSEKIKQDMGTIMWHWQIILDYFKATFFLA